MSDPIIGLISGTGPQGRGVALRFALAGVPVAIGSRSLERAQASAEQLNALLAGSPGAGEATPVPIEAMDNPQAVARSAFVLLTVPFEHATRTLETYRGDFRPGSVFVDVTVPLLFGKGDVQVEIPPEGSGSRHLRAVLPPEVPFTAAFKTLPAHVLEAAHLPLACDTFVFGDNREAKERLIEVIRKIPGLRPLDVGGLSAAATVEGMTALLIRINRRMRSKDGRFSVVGIG